VYCFGWLLLELDWLTLWLLSTGPTLSFILIGCPVLGAHYRTLVSGAGNCSGTIIDGGYNLDSGNTCGFSATGSLSNVTDPKLSHLSDNGGLTQTIALLPGSPAIDVIPAAQCTDQNNQALTTDQRGVARPQGSNCDIGAFEFKPGVVAARLVFSTQPAGASVGKAFATQPVVVAQDVQGNIVTGFSGSVSLAIKAGSGTSGAVLGGTVTVNAVNGIASFSGLSIDKAGSGYVLTASNGNFIVDSNSFEITPNSPVINSISPGSAQAQVGATDLTITVSGSGFFPASVVQWEGTNLTTTYVNDSTLIATIPGTNLSSVKVALLIVNNGASYGGTSNQRAFYVTQSNTTVTDTSTTSTSAGQVSTSAAIPGITMEATGGSGTISVASFTGNPGGIPVFQNGSGYFDARVTPNSSFSEVKVIDCNLNGGSVVYWYDGSTWLEASKQVYNATSNCITITVNNISSPNLTQLNGTYFASGNRSGISVRLINSQGQGLSGGTVRYYDGTWRNAGNTDASGTVSFTPVNGNANSLSYEMTYNNSRQIKTNIAVSTNPVIFQTITATVELKNSLGTAITGGSVRYYALSWQTFGTTGTDGKTILEILPGTYSFEMTYNNGRQTKTNQNITAPNPEPVVFHTTATTLRLATSTNAPIEGGVARFFALSWQNFGTTGADGNTVNELLPGTYSFEMSYANSRLTRTNISVPEAATFQYDFRTVNVPVRLENSQGAPLSGGVVRYFQQSWQNYGTTGEDGLANKELMPGTYSFEMTYNNGRQTLTNVVITDPVGSPVLFKTVATAVRLQNSQGAGLSGGVVRYFALSWQSFGTTGADGTTANELLPGTYSFEMTYANGRQTKINVAIAAGNATVPFTTVPVTVKLTDAGGAGIAGGVVRYFALSWVSFGTTGSDGTVVKELLPGTYSFEMTYNGNKTTKQQEVGTNPLVTFQTT
jgi:hypothetical protein